MLIIVDSKNGSTLKLAQNLNLDSQILQLDESNCSKELNQDVLLVTYTIGKGKVPKLTSEFVKNNVNNIKFVISNGSVNYLANFGKAARLIGEELNLDNIAWVHKGGDEKQLKILKKHIEKTFI